MVMKEQEEKVYFAFRASLRVMGAGTRHAELTARLGPPSTVLRAGEYLQFRGKVTSRRASQDIWIFESMLDEEASLSAHLKWLGERIVPHLRYLRGLIRDGVKVDIFCGYRSSSDNAGFEIDPRALETFVRLGAPLGVSVVIAGE